MAKISKTQKTVIEALDYRIDQLGRSIACLHNAGFSGKISVLEMEARKDELETLRSYVKENIIGDKNVVSIRKSAK